MIHRALIIDTETTGLDPAADSVIEIGAVLYSVEHRTTLAQFSRLMPIGANPAESINRIPPSALGPDLPDVGGFDRLIEVADVFVAHNADFDSAFLSRWRERPWLCTRNDFAWPMQVRAGESLVSLALNHGIGVTSAHRALTDCQLIAALFDRAHWFGADLQAMFVRAMRPKALFQSLQPFDQNQVAKDHGFEWNKPGREKKWTRYMAIEDAATLPFKAIEIRA